MTEEIVAPAMPQFENGQPSFEYDHIFRCFKEKGNGLLFRMVNSQQKKWAFYNDTADTIMQVKARFSPDCKVEKLNRARATKVPVGTEENPDLCETVVTLEVYPLVTEPFIKGDVNGFQLEFHTEQIPVNDVKFMNRHCLLPRYDKVYKCFKNEGNGLLFRLVDEKEGKWYYYNDTREFRMTATVNFPNEDDVKPLGNTETVPVQDDDSAVVYQITVDPGKAEPFIEGRPTSYHQAFNADPIDESCVNPKEAQYVNSEPDSSIIDVSQCKVFKCFKENGNGLLFRLVDEKAGRWAFYNDTQEYVMKPKVRFFGGALVVPGPDAHMAPDPEEEDTTVVTIEVPPCETRLFIEGRPAKYEVSVVADSIHKSVPEDSPEFAHGEPDRKVMNYDAVYQCFKDKPDARLFRIVDSSRQQWGFYNDTTDVFFTARFTFDAEGKVRTLGDTEKEQNSDNETQYVVSIPPLTTVEFVQGDVRGFKSQFTGKRKVPLQASA
ncbi:hypothetical protein LPMP_200140 [Leishmania panamensis]|uniref:DUF1935 domain-containing protein n=2 Tax=Leishmania guyanensis species complex TaxID=38579 RepID=A0A088S7F2_LEIPA|nr:hypothetical protein LPMP_200140 [Leishmania panamensis]AIN97506.1 hypothetical protein LPMP_200140 [Leishmania panamensis]